MAGIGNVVSFHTNIFKSYNNNNPRNAINLLAKQIIYRCSTKELIPNIEFSDITMICKPLCCNSTVAISPKGSHDIPQAISPLEANFAAL